MKAISTTEQELMGNDTFHSVIQQRTMKAELTASTQASVHGDNN